MARIKELLAQLAEKLGLNRPLLQRARRRYRANRRRAFTAHNAQLRYQEQADRYRAQGHLIAAGEKDKQVARARQRASKNHDRAQFWLGRIKVLVGRIDGIEADAGKLEAELKKLHDVEIHGNRATGGSQHQRLKAVALKSAANCASGVRANFYSQTGSFDAKHCVTGPASSHRDDCSSWFGSVYWSAGLPDPSDQDFQAGYTETLAANGKQIPRSELSPGDAIIYGPPGATHHVEMWVGPGTKTIGHGSAPVDPGVIDLFGDGDYRCFTY
jgi:cell wall-associated NlpC family hydrolase